MGRHRAPRFVALGGVLGVSILATFSLNRDLGRAARENGANDLYEIGDVLQGKKNTGAATGAGI